MRVWYFKTVEFPDGGCLLRNGNGKSTLLPRMTKYQLSKEVFFTRMTKYQLSKEVFFTRMTKYQLSKEVFFTSWLVVFNEHATVGKMPMYYLAWGKCWKVCRGCGKFRPPNSSNEQRCLLGAHITPSPFRVLTIASKGGHRVRCLETAKF